MREPAHLAEAFAVEASYIVTDDDHTGWGFDIYQLSLHFSRPFAALKIWVSLLAHGWDAYERGITHDLPSPTTSTDLPSRVRNSSR